jgi:hypothetical protein
LQTIVRRFSAMRFSLVALVPFGLVACTKPNIDVVVAEPIAPPPSASAPEAPTASRPGLIDTPGARPDAPPSVAPAPPATVTPTTSPGPADNRAVDPSTLLADARARVPAGSILSSLEVHYVGTNGRVDLGAPTYKAWIRYRFRREPIPAEQVPGAPVGVVKPAQHFPDTIVHYEGSTVNVIADQVGDLGSPANGDPACSLAQVWAGARAAGAPANAVADATYPASMVGGRVWNFYVQGTASNGAPLFHAYIDDPGCKVRSRNEGLL